MCVRCKRGPSVRAVAWRLKVPASTLHRALKRAGEAATAELGRRSKCLIPHL